MINTQDISEIIYEIRGKKVMLDSDLASLFGYETKNLNRIVKRNINDFDEDSYFQLTNEELKSLRRQIGTLKVKGRGAHSKYLPHVFTRDGIEKFTILAHTTNLSDIVSTIRKSFDRIESLNIPKSLQMPENTRTLKDMIYKIRGEYVMLDFDLAVLYGCQNGTKTINLAVKRNEEKFMERHMFQLTKEEAEEVLRFQFETSNTNRGGRRYAINAFTESGVVMLSTILNTPVASSITVKIVDEFVAMKKYISKSLVNQEYINNIVLEDHERLITLEKSFKEFDKKQSSNAVYFSGQIFDAYSKIKDIFSKAKKEIIIIDGYADITVLDMISSLKCNVILIVKSNAKLSVQDINKYNLQYNNLKVVFDNSYHDRYFILDRKKIYHCGASINHAGSRTFSINLLEDNMVIKAILDDVKKII